MMMNRVTIEHLTCESHISKSCDYVTQLMHRPTLIKCSPPAMLKSFRRLWRELRHIATGILTWYLVGATARQSPTSSAVETSGSISAFIDHSLTRSLAARRDNARTTYRSARRHHTGVSRSWRLLGPTCMRGPYCRPARVTWGSAQGGGTCRRLNGTFSLHLSVLR